MRRRGAGLRGQRRRAAPLRHPRLRAANALAVLHQQHLQLGHVVDDELVEARRQQVPCLGIRAVARLRKEEERAGAAGARRA